MSVVIPTLNPGSNISRCLDSIARQTYKNIEVIVVDNFSRDMPLGEFKRPATKIVYSRTRRTAARNIGAGRASGGYLLHLDADMELHPDVVKDCVDACISEDVDAVIIPEISAGSGFWAKCVGLQKEIVLGQPGHEAARFLSRRAFDTVGGYDDRLESGEDFDLQYRLEASGFSTARTSSWVSHHVGAARFAEILAKYRLYGSTVASFRAKYGIYLRRKQSFVKLMTRRWMVLARDPAHAAGYLFLSFVALVAQRQACSTPSGGAAQ